MENNKKILIPTIVAVSTLILLVFGATYAYFTIGSTNNFGTKDLSATIEDMADAVVLEKIENELSLNVTRAMMSQDNKYTTYYASGNSTPANIAKMSVAGEGRYACDYTISVTKSSSSEENDLHTTVKNERGYNDVYFRINKDSYDFARTTSFPITYSGTAYGITKNTPRYITSNLEIKNTSSNQNYLKGKDITLTLEVTEFDCYLNEADDSAPIYAIYDENEQILAFYQNHDDVNVGDSYDGYTISKIYTNLNNTNYTSNKDVPWNIVENDYEDENGLWVPGNKDMINVTKVIFEDIISPQNTAYWFSDLNNDYFELINIGNLETSKVTNMSYMFQNANIDQGGSFSIDLSHLDVSSVINMEGMFDGAGYIIFDPNLSEWDTSNVTNMSYMFKNTGWSDTMYVDLRNWDTSNVEDMSYMFYSAGGYIGFEANISTWDTSKVTNMSHMFENSGNNGSTNIWSIGDITRREITANGKIYTAWDTSKVTDMSYMFAELMLPEETLINLTSWQVPLVTNYEEFNSIDDKIIAPNWVN